MALAPGEGGPTDPSDLTVDPEKIREAARLLAGVKASSAEAGDAIANKLLRSTVEPGKSPDWMVIPEDVDTRNQLGVKCIFFVRESRGNWSGVWIGQYGDENCRAIEEVVAKAIEGQEEPVTGPELWRLAGEDQDAYERLLSRLYDEILEVNSNIDSGSV